MPLINIALRSWSYVWLVLLNTLVNIPFPPIISALWPALMHVLRRNICITSVHSALVIHSIREGIYLYLCSILSSETAFYHRLLSFIYVDPTISISRMVHTTKCLGTIEIFEFANACWVIKIRKQCTERKQDGLDYLLYICLIHTVSPRMSIMGNSDCIICYSHLLSLGDLLRNNESERSHIHVVKNINVIF